MLAGINLLCKDMINILKVQKSNVNILTLLKLIFKKYSTTT